MVNWERNPKSYHPVTEAVPPLLNKEGSFHGIRIVCGDQQTISSNLGARDKGRGVSGEW